MTRMEELETEAAELGLTVHSYSPGDGVTRYRFFRNAPANQTYFGPANGVWTALGLGEARKYLAVNRTLVRMEPTV